MSPRSRILALLAGVLLVATPQAGAAFSLESVTVEPQVPAGGPLPPGDDPFAAGAHPDFLTVLEFADQGNGAADSVATYDMHLAPGIVSYVNHVETCTTEEFAQEDASSASSCPPGSLVGSVVTDVTIRSAAVDVPVSLTDGRIYNLEPPPGFPAALGIDIAPPGPIPGLPALERTKLLATVTIDPHDLALTATVHDMPSTASGLPVHIDRITQRLLGYVDGASFFTNPTSCIEAPVTVTATSHGGAVSTNEDAYTPTDCANVPFGTILTVSADPPMTDATSTISFNVKPAAFDVPRANSHVRSTTVTAPPGVLINPALAARLDACTDAQFAQSDTSVPAACPPSSAVGDITFVSPILGAFPGKAYFGTQTPTDRLRLFLNVPLYGANIKVSAHVNPSYETGQITTVFDELAQIAFTDFTLTFKGGPRSALVTPTTCGTHTATAIVNPWSGGPPATSSGSFAVSYDGEGGACLRVFRPTMATAVTNRRGGATTTFTLVANRPDRHVPIGKMAFRLPAGLVGNLALKGLTQCALDDAAAGRCPASSRIGSVRAVAGSGTEPPTLPGDAYLTKPKAAGDPAGLSVKVPAKLGPVDAGTVIVGARLVLRSDGGLDAISDAIPALQLGIPLAMRQLRVAIDRPGLMRNPTSCGTKTARGHFDAIGGGSADASSTLTFVDCDRLPFGPRMRVFVGAERRTGTGAHPPFVTSIRAGAGDAAIARARVLLPKALATNVAALNAACEPADLAEDRCSKRARVATARALSPLFAEPVTGPVYLVKREGGGLPRLVVQLRNPVAIQFEGTVTVGGRGRIATTFRQVPDLPVARFTLRFHGGAYGALAATRNLCKRRLVLPVRFAGHNGKKVKQRERIGVRGCPARRR